MIRAALRPWSVALPLFAAACSAGGVPPAELPGGGVRASAPPGALPAANGAPSTAAGAHSRFRTATGAVFSYDASSRVLVLRSAGGESRFVVAPDARLWVASRRAGVERLAASAGVQATVAYSEKDGVRTTHTVRLSRARPQRDR